MAPDITIAPVPMLQWYVMDALSTGRADLVRKGQRLEYFTIICNSLEGLVSIVAGLIAGSVSLGMAQASYTTWRDYKGSPDSSNYSALTQINRSNVSHLDAAWSYVSRRSLSKRLSCEDGRR